MLFEGSKFHLIDVGAKRHSSKDRDRVVFGETCPPWSRSAKYLGVIIDGKLDFKEFLNYIIDKVTNSMWRLYKHSNVKDGASPYVLLSIFKTWILPHFEYGACIWIFSIFDGTIDMDREPSSGYILFLRVLLR